MAKLKELYLGKSIEDLIEQYQLPNDLQRKPIKIILQSVGKLQKEAERYRLLGDQEMSYILYMKYFGLIQKIRDRPDYSKQKRFITEMIGNDQIRIAMDCTEDLATKLKQRYDDLERKDMKMNQSMMNHNADTDNNKADSDLANYIESFNSINCQDLYKMIQDRSESILIMDCRPEIDYDKSHLVCSNCLNVPQEILVAGRTAGSIQNKLTEKSKWASRSIKNQIILMDWDCKSEDPPLDTAIWRLKDILMNWDQDTIYRSPIKILIGGYEDFALMYPNQCTNPIVIENVIFVSGVDLIDEIEYPSINDIVMKDDSVFNQSIAEKIPIIPTVDRKSKLAAIKTYTGKRVLDIMSETETLIDKNLENKKQLNDAEIEWENLKTTKKKMSIDEEKRLMHIKEQELIYKIMQLENHEKDFEMQFELKLSEIQQREKNLDEEKSAQELEKQRLAQERIEFKMQQQKAIDVHRENDRHKREIEKLEREKILEEAREAKRRLPPPENEEVIRPKIPQIDRSIKPNLNEYSNEIQRDFSPVHGLTIKGLTGLKNLGNTCYMNSILQCLNNTSLFVDYVLSDTYKKYINSNNKTGGHIMEEVAAVIKVLWTGNYKAIACRNLRSVFGKFQQIFSGFEQQDSHEFLTILIDWLHLDSQALIKPKPKPNARLNPPEKSWLDFTKSCESFILRLFYGQIKSTVKCRECSTESATYDCFSNLSLELPANANSCYIENCLNLYFSGEEINGWNCPKCKEKRSAIKKLCISKLPPVLVIHLKRFYADPEGDTYKKKQNYVKFQLDGLDFEPFISKYESRLPSSKIYSLYAVSNHYGSMESGHYTAFCKNNFINKWAKFDDSFVSILDSNDIVSSAAYILFYVKNFSSQLNLTA